ncbi:MAG: preprotein translocase subunit SecY [Actinobacteria bacterium 69-20]|nr:preprotein translocase subunit SecY [Actinomycetota bacterium]OJV28779.1 MAG: preprotein translocase subunit SecY [Actinobacteria bacterium 69-20]
MLTAFVSALKTPDLRKKILFTLAMLALYRFGATLPSPGVNYKAIHQCLNEIGGGANQAFTILNLFSGGALLQLSVFALGIMPYITASIIVQLLVVVIPRYEQYKQEGQAGQAKMTQHTRYITIGLGVLQSTGFIALALNGQMFAGCSQAKDVINGRDPMTLITLVIVMTAGTAAIMWMGELITDRGIGNGMSLLIFTSIASRIVPEGQNILTNSTPVVFGVLMVIAIAIIIAVVYIEQGQRRIPVQYAKRMIGRKMYGGTSTYLPLKVNQGGVIPVIFASSLLYIPTLITSLLSGSGAATSAAVTWVNYYVGSPGSWSHMLLYFALIIFFTYFYVGIQFNPVDRADDLKKYGGFIPGIRPGRPTAEYLQFVLSRITLPGSLYLGIVAIMPDFFLSYSGSTSSNQNFPFGGVSVLILVAVGLDTMKQIESQLMQRNYEGFLR